MLKNDEINFVENTFLLIDYGEDICSPVWVNVVMLGGVAVNETRNAYW